MPVLIVGASSDVGRHLAALLLAEDAQVRVYVSTEDRDLRAAGCKVAVGEYDDMGRIESAMEQVHTVVHLAGDAEPAAGRSIEWMIEETTDVAVRAAGSADVRRFLATSHVGAEPAADNVFLAARGRADALVAGAGMEYGVIRCAPVIGLGTHFGAALRAARGARTPVAPGRGSQRLNPVAAVDVARALFLADSREGAVHGTWNLGGPETISYDDLIARVTGRDRVAHKRTVPGLPQALAQVYADDALADPAEFLAAFPMEMTPLDVALSSLR